MPALAVIAEEPSNDTVSLDAIPYELAVAIAVRSGLAELSQALLPADLAILSKLPAHRMSPGQRPEPWSLSADAKQAIPVAAALLEWNRTRPGPALTCLCAVLVNLALGPEGQDPRYRKRIDRLARIVRSAIEKPRAGLRSLIAGAGTVTSLAKLLDEEVENGSQIHLEFNEHWSTWVRYRLARWVMGDPSRIRDALGPSQDLLLDLDAPQVPLWGDDQNDDDQVEWSGTEVSGPAFEGLGTRATNALAQAHTLLRRSGESPLSIHSDHLVPDEIARFVALKALKRGTKALSTQSRTLAEQYLALGLQLASGFREMDLARICWGSAADQGDAILLIEEPVLSLRVRRPPHAVMPALELKPHLKLTADRLHWPLPPSLHAALKALADAPGPNAGEQVLPNAGPGKPYSARSTMASLMPEAHMGASRFRLALAAGISDRWGPEVAQLAMRDTFSTSLGPAYYSAIPEAALSQTISSILERWFGEPVPSPAGRNGQIGSRLVLVEDIARQWPQRLRKTAYAAARMKGGRTDSLVAHRNQLAGALCAATGLRPGGSIGNIHLDSVIPEYGLVILEDKQVDVLRRTRVAATGWRWTAELRRYLDRLIDLAQCNEDPIAAWANAVLLSEQPLFSQPGEQGGARLLGMDELVAAMPKALQEVPNYYRHRLNQRLMEKGVDWELRHAQLGWVVTPTFALSDSSALSARMFGARLGDVVDELLMEEGWFINRRLSKWSWRGVPQRPLKDWEAERKRFESEHARHVRNVREEFAAKRKHLEIQVLPRLATAVAETLPLLRLDVSNRSLEPRLETPPEEFVALTPEHYLLLRDHVRRTDQDSASALEALAAEYLIHEIVSKAIKAKMVAGPIPPRRHLGVTAQLSAFMPGLGLAVRHAEAMRERLDELVSKDMAHDKAGVAQFAVMANTPYRNFQDAAAAAAAAPDALRGYSKRDWLCVPAIRDRKESPMVIGGAVAALLARRAAEAPTAKALSRDQMSAWLERRFGDVAGCAGNAADRVERVVATLQMAGRLELSGPERLVMDGQPVACVETTRGLAIRDNWPLRTKEHAQDTPGKANRISEAASGLADSRASVSRRSYSKLTSALNLDVSRSVKGRKSDGKRGWARRLDVTLRELQKETADGANVRLLVEYSRHRLNHGGSRVARLSQRTLHKEITRFGSMLLDVLGKRALLQLDGLELQAVYLAVLAGKPDASRADVLEELAKFHKHMEAVHHAPDVDFEPLRSFAGARVRARAPGGLSDVEIHRVLDELMKDLEQERARPDAAPLEVRACALRILAFILLEASGARPSSIHGLVLGDLHFGSGGSDRLHIHRTGEYGEAKTLTSVGFIPLDGGVWKQHRSWVLAWLNQDKQQSGSHWWKLPVFAGAPASHRRYDRTYLTDRIGQLLKWVTSNPKARVYWLRKRRITARMEAALEDSRAAPRTVYRALREVGHTGIATTLGSYVHDASVPVRTYLGQHSAPNRAGIIGMTGLSANALDQAWHRRRRSGAMDFIGVVLDRLNAKIASPPLERITDPPILYRQKPLVAAHLDIYARARRDGDVARAQARSGISPLQAEVLEGAVKELLFRTGAAPWAISGLRQERGMMKPARRLDGTRGLFELMNMKPDPWLEILQEAWLSQAYIQRLYTKDVILELRTQEARRAAEQLIVATRPRLEIASIAGVHVLKESDPGDVERNAHGSALRWVFAMHWLCQFLITEGTASHTPSTSF